MIKACILSVSGPVLLPDERALLGEAQPWGVILMGRSCVSRTQVQKLVDSIWEETGRPCLIFIDQEGGRVARLKAPEWPLFPRGKEYGQLYACDPFAGLEACYLAHRLIASELVQMSVHADCTPVVDLPVPGAHDIIGDRAFGKDPASVAALAGAALRGLSDGGVAGVIKHIPGHGRSQADSHEELPRILAGPEELGADFDAFARVTNAAMAMTAHISYEAIDAGVAATHSRKIIQDVIRDTIGFDGLLMSDDLGMKALGGSLSERAKRAIEAGCDMLLHCSGFVTDPGELLAEMREVADASPVLSGKALERAEHALAVTTNELPFDLEEGWARFYEIFPALGAAA